MTLIGIVGAIGSGKDTVADYLCEQHGFQRLAFAAKVKDVAATVFGWNRDQLEGRTPASRAWRECMDPYWGITPRQALQQIGTDLFRKQVRDDIWVKSVERELLDHPDQNFVLTDCRFPNEVEMVRRLNGKILYLQRGFIPVWGAAAASGGYSPESFGIHPSEWNVYALCSQADLKIDNNGSKEDLYEILKNFLTSQTCDETPP
jgi:hypothetical protein